jgi:hypothetical protein
LAIAIALLFRFIKQQPRAIQTLDGRRGLLYPGG